MDKPELALRNIIIRCHWCGTKNRIIDASKRDRVYRCPSCKEIIDRESILLQHILNSNDFPFDLVRDSIAMTFISSGSPVIEAGTEVELTAYWRTDVITIGIRLLELHEDYQDILDSYFLSMLLVANSGMDFCKFCLDSEGITLLLDIDAHFINFEEINSGINSLLNGIEIYVDILSEWVNILQEMPDFEYDDFLYYEDVPQIEALTEAKTKPGVLFRTLFDIGKLGLKAATLSGIAAAAGVPGTAIAAIIAAVASSTAKGD